MKTNNYEIKKNVEKVQRGQSTGFLTRDISKEVKRQLLKNEYNIFMMYPDADKVILYAKSEPKIRLYQIICKNELQHSAILGSLFGLNISAELFGDIVFMNDNFYICFLDEIGGWMENNFSMVGREKIELMEVSKDTLLSYERKYQKLEFIVSSLRMDTILSKIMQGSREKAQEKIKAKEVFVNYELLNRGNYFLHEGDVFSARKYGKYRFDGIIKKTKKDNYVIAVAKFL